MNTMGFMDMVRRSFSSGSASEATDKKVNPPDQERKMREMRAVLAEQRSREVSDRKTDVEKLAKYLREMPIMTFSYKELDRASDDQLNEWELGLRTDYAAFVDAMPANLRLQFPEFNQLKNFPFPDSNSINEAEQPANEYTDLIAVITDELPRVSLKGAGFGQTNELSDLIVGRLQSFVIGAEMLDEALNRVSREEGRAFTK